MTGETSTTPSLSGLEYHSPKVDGESKIFPAQRITLSNGIEGIRILRPGAPTDIAFDALPEGAHILPAGQKAPLTRVEELLLKNEQINDVEELENSVDLKGVPQDQWNYWESLRLSGTQFWIGTGTNKYQVNDFSSLEGRKAVTYIIDGVTHMQQVAAGLEGSRIIADPKVDLRPPVKDLTRDDIDLKDFEEWQKREAEYEKIKNSKVDISDFFALLIKSRNKNLKVVTDCPTRWEKYDKAENRPIRVALGPMHSQDMIEAFMRNRSSTFVPKNATYPSSYDNGYDTATVYVVPLTKRNGAVSKEIKDRLVAELDGFLEYYQQNGDQIHDDDFIGIDLNMGKRLNLIRQTREDLQKYRDNLGYLIVSLYEDYGSPLRLVPAIAIDLMPENKIDHYRTSVFTHNVGKKLIRLE